jgi:hypothetical protein
MAVFTVLYGALAVLGLYLMRRSAVAGLPAEGAEDAARLPTFTY